MKKAKKAWFLITSNRNMDIYLTLAVKHGQIPLKLLIYLYYFKYEYLNNYYTSTKEVYESVGVLLARHILTTSITFPRTKLMQYNENFEEVAF